MRHSRHGTPVELNPVAAVAWVSGQRLIALYRDIVYLVEYAMRSSQTGMGKAEE
jgi:hypothetical protein